MKLSELLTSISWADVKASLLWNYPSTEDSLEGYRRAFSCLQNLQAVASNMRIFVRRRFREDLDEKSFTEVTGRDGTRNRNLEDFQYLAQPVDPEYASAETDYSLVFEPWEGWLGMDIDPQTLDYPALQIAAHCLWEMTIHGFEPSQVQAERDELKWRLDDLEAMTEEDRKERLIPWEQLRKELEGEEPE
jgi:hypothetical protein